MATRIDVLTDLRGRAEKGGGSQLVLWWGSDGQVEVDYGLGVREASRVRGADPRLTKLNYLLLLVFFVMVSLLCLRWVALGI